MRKNEKSKFEQFIYFYLQETKFQLNLVIKLCNTNFYFINEKKINLYTKQLALLLKTAYIFNT